MSKHLKTELQIQYLQDSETLSTKIKANIYEIQIGAQTNEESQIHKHHVVSIVYTNEHLCMAKQTNSNQCMRDKIKIQVMTA